MVVIFKENSMASNAACLPYSRIGREVKEEDVNRIWLEVSKLIIEKLAAGHGVKIPNFASITYKEMRTDTHNNKTYLRRVPLILLSKDLVLKNSLCDRIRPSYNMNLPEEPLNYTLLACRANLCSKLAAEIAVNEVVQAFRRAIYYDTHVEFHFPLIGSLKVKCGRVDVCFCKTFIEKLCFDRELLVDREFIPLPEGVWTF